MATQATFKAPSTFTAKPFRTIYILDQVYVDISSQKQFIQGLLPFVMEVCSCFSNYLDEKCLDEITKDAMVTLWKNKGKLRKERPGVLIMRTIIQKTFDYLRNMGKNHVVDEIMETLIKMQ